MTRKTYTLAYGILAMALLTGLGGCASTSATDGMNSEINQANETARNAEATAEAASREAAAASQAAAEAMAAAQEAKAQAQETDEKVDRMFKKSMYK